MNLAQNYVLQYEHNEHKLKVVNTFIQHLKTQVIVIEGSAGSGKSKIIEALVKDDENIFRNQIRQITERTTKYYAECLIKVLSDVPEETIFKRLAIFKNMATGIMYGDRIMEESLEVLGIDKNREELLEEMVKFAAAGFRA